MTGVIFIGKFSIGVSVTKMRNSQCQKFAAEQKNLTILLTFHEIF